MAPPLARTLLALTLLLVSHVAHAQTQARAYEVVAFDKGYDHLLLKVDEAGVGTLYQVRMMFQGRLVEEKMAPMGHEDETAAALRRKHKLDVDPVKGQETPDKKHVLMGFKDKSQYRLFFMEGSKVGYYDSIELKTGSKGETGEAYLKEAYWTPDGRKFVAIVHQTLASDRLDLDADQFYVFTFKRYKIRFGGDDKASGDKGGR